jgi:hypothetical protein
VQQGNIDGAVTGPTSSVSGNVAVFDGATGKVIKDSGIPVGTGIAFVTDADEVPTAYADRLRFVLASYEE